MRFIGSSYPKLAILSEVKKASPEHFDEVGLSSCYKVSCLKNLSVPEMSLRLSCGRTWTAAASAHCKPTSEGAECTTGSVSPLPRNEHSDSYGENHSAESKKFSSFLNRTSHGLNQSHVSHVHGCCPHDFNGYFQFFIGRSQLKIVPVLLIFIIGYVSQSLQDFFTLIPQLLFYCSYSFLPVADSWIANE